MFSKCADTMEQGKRLENMSWRLWTREAFCGAPDRSGRRSSHPWSLSRTLPRAEAPVHVPELSSSPDSDASSDALTSSPTETSAAQQQFQTRKPADCRRRPKDKHITPVDLEKIVSSIREKRRLQPLSPLLIHAPAEEPSRSASRADDTTPRPPSSSEPRMVPESSASTVGTAIGSDLSNMSPPVGSDASTSTDLSSHSVVRGFSLGCISSSYRSQPQQGTSPTPILKTPAQTKTEPLKKKGAIFTLGGSSDEGGDSSLENNAFLHSRSSLSEGLKRSASKKQTSFKDEVSTRTIPAHVYPNEEVIESDDEEVSESAIEDEEDDDAWEDSETEDGRSSADEKDMFQRVDSRPNLTSRRSLLTSLMHEKDRAEALQNEASRSTPAMRRSRTSTPNGPSLGTSPQEQVDVRGTPIPRPRPAIMTTSNMLPPALSPRTTRRNMLLTELTESLRKHLLWERQQKNATSNAALKRRHTSNDVKNLKQYPADGPSEKSANHKENSKNNSWNNYFDHGLQEYHEKGW